MRGGVEGHIVGAQEGWRGGQGRCVGRAAEGGEGRGRAGGRGGEGGGGGGGAPGVDRESARDGVGQAGLDHLGLVLVEDRRVARLPGQRVDPGETPGHVGRRPPHPCRVATQLLRAIGEAGWVGSRARGATGDRGRAHERRGHGGRTLRSILGCFSSYLATSLACLTASCKCHATRMLRSPACRTFTEVLGPDWRAAAASSSSSPSSSSSSSSTSPASSPSCAQGSG